jgi:hypothetical protein
MIVRRVATYLRSNALAVVALFVALGGTSYAVSNSLVTKNGQLAGCVSRSGILTVKRPGRRCARGQTTISWNVVGPTGAAGPAGGVGPRGQIGPQGPPGPSSGPAGGDLTGSYPSPRLAPPEPWHNITTFGECALGDSWRNFGPGWETAAYYRDPLGVVHVKGSVHCEAEGTGRVFMLPEGFRPAAIQFFQRPRQARPSIFLRCFQTAGSNRS